MDRPAAGPDAGPRQNGEPVTTNCVTVRSPVAAHLYGHPADEAIGRPARDLAADEIRDRRPAVVPAVA
jgi:hypothetical protein